MCRLLGYAARLAHLSDRRPADGAAPREGQVVQVAPDAELRAKAYQENFRVFGEDGPILGQIYQTILRDWHNENVNLRKFKNSIAPRNLNNDVPDEAVEALLGVARKNVSIFQRYFKMKAKHLGMKKMRRYDIYAPIAASKKTYDWDEAVKMVLDAFNGFSPKVAELAKRVFDEKRIDSEIRKGKRGGAFCSTVLPRLTPWVLVNYAGRVRDVATLAHELGHALHSMLAQEHSILTHHSSLPLAETASVFAEMLMTDRLLREEKNPVTRREILATAVDDVYATVLRQACFVRFERVAHEAVLAGASTEDLCDLYMENLRDQFGDSLEVSEEFRYEWLSIPHLFRTPFYCYAYSFGQLLVLALYRRYQEEGERFIPGYVELLASGGSEHPQDILGRMGIDITDPAFWQGGFDLVRGYIDELEAIKG